MIFTCHQIGSEYQMFQQFPAWWCKYYPFVFSIRLGILSNSILLLLEEHSYSSIIILLTSPWEVQKIQPQKGLLTRYLLFKNNHLIWCPFYWFIFLYTKGGVGGGLKYIRIIRIVWFFLVNWHLATIHWLKKNFIDWFCLKNLHVNFVSMFECQLSDLSLNFTCMAIENFPIVFFLNDLWLN